MSAAYALFTFLWGKVDFALKDSKRVQMSLSFSIPHSRGFFVPLPGFLGIL
jgi:hypothetical protein